MLQTQSSPKAINNNLSIAFANDNFGAFVPNHFPSAAFKNNLHWLQNNSSLTFKNFKNSPHYLPNASLFLQGASPLQKQFAPGFASFRLRSFLNPFSLKSAVKADFLTLEPSQYDNLHLAAQLSVSAGITHNLGNTFDSFTALGGVDVGNLITNNPVLMLVDMLNGDSFDEALEGKEDAINDISTILNAGGKGGSAGIMLNLSASFDKTSSKSSSATGSILSSGNNINILSLANSADKKDINIEGSGLMAKNDINLISNHNINITAASNNSSFKNIGGSVYGSIPIFGAGFSIGGEIHGAKNSNNYWTNSFIEAGNNLNITTQNDTTIKGANLLSRNDLAITTGNNLTIESLQNTSKERSFSVGGGYGNANQGNSVNASFSLSKADRKWVDNQTTIFGENSVLINTGNNTNIVGGVIANAKEITTTITNPKTGQTQNQTQLTDLGNLTLNTGSLTFQNIYDTDKARSFGMGVSYSDRTTQDRAAIGPNQPGTSQGMRNSGNAGFNLNYSMHDIEQTTKATIGNGAININGIAANDEQTKGLNRNIKSSQEITKNLTVDPINFSGSVSWDNRANGSGGLINPFKAKMEEWKTLISDPSSVITRNFADITSDLNHILNDTNLSSETKDKILNFSDQVAPKLWASPNTVLGFAYGGAGYLYGLATGQDVGVNIGNNAIQFVGNPLNPFNMEGAITLGNAINYVGGAKPEDITISYAESHKLQIYQNMLGDDIYNFYRSPESEKIILGIHEREHTYQAQILGPLFLPVYLFSGGISYKNPFEKAADQAGNKSYLNK